LLASLVAIELGSRRRRGSRRPGSRMRARGPAVHLLAALRVHAHRPAEVDRVGHGDS